MIVFCDESWKNNTSGKMIGTLAAVGLPRKSFNKLVDSVFFIASKYFGLQNARAVEIKGKRLLCTYEYRRQAGGTVSMKMAFARELLEVLRSYNATVFASVVESDRDVQLLCSDKLERPYLYLMERINGWATENNAIADIVFDDRGLKANSSVSESFTEFLVRSRSGRSWSGIMRTPLFAYSNCSRGIQMADLVCTVVNRYFTDRNASPMIPLLYKIVESLQYRAKEANIDGYMHKGIKFIT